MIKILYLLLFSSYAYYRRMTPHTGLLPSVLLEVLLHFLKCWRDVENYVKKTINEPSHEIMVLFVLSGARCLILVGLFVYFMCANSEGAVETARMRKLA